MTPKRVIGNNGKLPWKLPSDMKRFRSITTAQKNVIMGRKTWESIPEKFRPLPERTNIVVTRNLEFEAAGAIVAVSPEAALTAVAGPEVCVIGGSEIYAAFLPLADILHITVVEAGTEGDAFFPEVPWEEWRQISASDSKRWDPKDEFPLAFTSYERKSRKEQ
jgi:dihydrofolate reductase